MVTYEYSASVDIMEAVPDGEEMAMVGPKRSNILKSIVNICF
jgi:hypothetical protein